MVDKAGSVSAHGGIDNVSTINAEHITANTLKNKTEGARKINMKFKQKLWQRARGCAPEEKSTSHLERVVLSRTHTLPRARIFLFACNAGST